MAVKCSECKTENKRLDYYYIYRMGKRVTLCEFCEEKRTAKKAKAFWDAAERMMEGHPND